MNLSFDLKYTFAFSCMASLLLSASAGPVFVKPYPLTFKTQRSIAPWWQDYLMVEAHKQPPSFTTVIKANYIDLPGHFIPFQQRITRLEQLKRWALSHPETRRALTQQQKATLAKPFFGWTENAIRNDMMDRVSLHSRLRQEKDFVAEIEGVLQDIAKHLPDVSPR